MKCLQLKVVLWKNLIIRRRHWFLTIWETLLPVLLFLLIAYGRSKINGLNKTEIMDVTYNAKEPIIYSTSGINLGETELFYSPSNLFFEDIIHRVQEKFQILNNNVRGFPSSEKLLEEYAKTNTTVIAILFDTEKPETHFAYTLRYHENFFSWDTEKLYANQYSFVPGQGSVYLWKGFLSLQKALDFSFIEKINGSEHNINIQTLEFPYPPYKLDSGLSSLFLHYLPLITLFSFIFVCPAVLKRVVEEKYSGIKELMRMIGMKSWMLWLGWFVYSVTPMIFSVALITLLMKIDFFGANYPLVEYASGGVLFVFLILYCIAVTTFCFSLSTLFSKPTLATLVGLLVWILSYFIPKYILESRTTVSFCLHILLMLFPNMALHYGYSAISVYEEREIGIQWINFYQPGGGGANEITMLHVFLLLLSDTFFYMVLTFYIDGINPGKYGIRKSLLFPYYSLIETLKRRKEVDHEKSEVVEFRELNERLSKGIQLIELTKKYGKKTVVNSLTLDIYQGQISVLLGHNGAGKSTTMGMITGMIDKSGGHIIMDGKSIRSNLDISRSIGLCPQHNLFFPDLTVSEHLQFFAMLKGKTVEEAQKEINELLEKLNLKEKANAMAHTLSGGMKRKLCLGMAVIGGSKVLILDEPSSGMDPESRRHLWDLLLGWRNDRTILITTHFMEEADALADWIAIMDEGNLKCFGTPMSLKKHYETGYNLCLRFKEGTNIELAVKGLLTKLGESIKCKSTNGNEVVFLLPFDNNESYIDLFERLESMKNDFDMENIAVTNTTLEDVFLNTKIDLGLNCDDNSEISSDHAFFNNDVKGEKTYILTLKALCTKRYDFIIKEYRTYVIPSLLAVFFLWLCIFLSGNLNCFSSSEGPPLNIQLDTYGKTRTYFNSSKDPTISKMKTFYETSVTEAKSRFFEVEDVSNAIIKEGTGNIAYYKNHMIVGAELSQNDYGIELTALYNNLAIHSAPISLNLLTNMVAKTILGEEYSISMTNWPLPNINTNTSSDELSAVQIGLLWLIILPIGFLFFLGSFIYFPYVELSTNFTQLQFMCGVSPWFYWITNFVYDFIVYIIFALIITLISMAWTPFCGLNEWAALISILIMYGLCGIPCAYLFGRKKYFSGAYALFVILGIMMGVLLTVIVGVLIQSGENSYIKIGERLKIIFLIVCPQFGLVYSGVEFSQKVINNYNFDHMPKVKLLSKCSNDPNPCCFGNTAECIDYKLYLPLLNKNFPWMALGAIIFLLINIGLHSYFLRKKWNLLKNKVLKYFPIKSEKNSTEKSLQVISEVPEIKNDTLRVTNLSKSYSRRAVVNNIEFMAKKGECLGILGVNGAGKSTTFRMLTREEIKDDGNIVANNITDVDQDDYLQKLGYCPQNDALNYILTGKQILQTMANLRGIKNPKLVDEFLRVFELSKIADTPCQYYSGGNKRKLSFAVAVIGFPDFILLDEPTNGVDPATRRKFWNVIKSVMKKKESSFILTSHSMNECEALCNNLTIMKGGTIKKRGTISKLKSDIGGYSVKIKLHYNQKKDVPGCDEVDGSTHSINSSTKTSPELKTAEELKMHLKEQYDGEIKDEHMGLLHYYIQDKEHNIRWSSLFRHFEDLKLACKDLIEDYSISEASLEDVFLNVAREE